MGRPRPGLVEKPDDDAAVGDDAVEVIEGGFEALVQWFFGVLRPALGVCNVEVVFDESLDVCDGERLVAFEDGGEHLMLFVGLFNGRPPPKSGRRPSIPWAFQSSVHRLAVGWETPTRARRRSSEHRTDDLTRPHRVHVPQPFAGNIELWPLNFYKPHNDEWFLLGP